MKEKVKKSKQGEILKHFLKGGSLSVKSCMEKFGTHKLSSRISDFEYKYGVRFNRKSVKIKSRYLGVDIFIVYSLTKDRISNIKKQLK